MSTRQEIVGGFYAQVSEDKRLMRNRAGQLEYRTTMEYIHRYADKDSKVLEIGAGTGRYSIALAKEGMDVTAVELFDCNLSVLKENGKGIEKLHALQGDGTELSMLEDASFDVTLCFGPMYHLYEAADVHKAIDEAIRVTKPGGVILFAFLSVYGIMFANYLYGNWRVGEEENFTKDYKTKHFKEQLFTGYDIVEFEELFSKKPVEKITVTGVDGQIEALEQHGELAMSDEDFESFAKWYLSVCEKRELLGDTNHLLYICKKKQ